MTDARADFIAATQAILRPEGRRITTYGSKDHMRAVERAGVATQWGQSEEWQRLWNGGFP